MLHKNAGFTLVEMIVVLVVLAIITMAVIPGFGNLISKNQRVADVNLLVSSLNFARTEAIKRGNNVTFSTDGGLGSGWCVHSGDASNDCASDQIRSFQSSGNMTFTETASDIVFDRRGFLVPQAAQSFQIYPDDCPSGDPDLRIIRVSPVGRTELDDGVCP
ncbi:GspH/FimT family pseudopilin [Marinobacter sp. CHS3-4]|uniref:GspH/FimT family pseudopilin n=1 Tax=Marinobacter sp. CHS3-4 TaxID=3045174 RepID=UPI0024B4FB54|nr:GspH/FimT family pseudopilin [Marinobacter sp. CHS3-4]MDI9246787.1 GspH/FimT family pseudopilin [Marinobacter sp. CHS3-4]